MSFFTEQTRVVEIDKHNRATLRKLSFGQRQEAISLSMKFNPFTQAADVDYARFNRERLYRALVSWEGPGFEGRPVTPENIDALPVEVADKLVAAMNELNSDLTADEGNASAAPTS